jgi:allantoinase
MKTGEWTLRSRRVVTHSGTRAADVVIRRETIAAVLEYDDPRSEGVILDAGDLAVLPGLVVLHREGHGRPDRRGFEEVTRDAASGGVTTLVGLPNDLEPESIRDSTLKARMGAAEGRIRVDCGLVVGLGRGNSKLIESWIESGVIAIEALLGSASPGSSDCSMEADLRAASSILARLDRPLLVHSERIGPQPAKLGGAGRFGSLLPGPEFEAIRLLIRLCRESGCRVHLVHPTASEALPMIAEARAEGLTLTVETCPHHLCFSTEEITDGLPTSPLRPEKREPDVRERLWEGLRTRSIDSIGSDDLRPFAIPSNSAPGEVPLSRRESASLRLVLPAVWTEARHRGFTLDDLALWMASNPAQAFGLENRKGAILQGLDADLVIFDPEMNFLANSEPDHREFRLPPLVGRILTGRVEATILRGTLIYQPGRYHEGPTGSVVLRLEETLPIPDSTT